MSPKDLAAYARVCHRYGISHLTVDGTSLTIDPAHKPASKPTQPQQDTSPEETFTDDDVVFWSAPST